MTLYPLKFKSIAKSKIWGGSRLKGILPDASDLSSIGEVWGLSGLEPESSLVTNGYLADNTINELIEVYMGELVGDKVFERFGNVFPLIIKLIDADDDLSIQVHPDDEYAQANGLECGKTEMWYVLESNGGKVVYGLKEDLTRQQLATMVDNHQLSEVLNIVNVEKGDFMLIESGTIHSLGKGVVVAEIQQTSDVTYRLYDYGRLDSNGQLRELHIKEALEVAKLSKHTQAVKHSAPAQQTKAENLYKTPYFTTNNLFIAEQCERDYAPLDSFVALLCVAGKADIVSDKENTTSIKAGEVVLLPATTADVSFVPKGGSCQLLEVYID